MTAAVILHRRTFLLGCGASLFAPRVASAGSMFVDRIPIEENGLFGTLFMPERPRRVPSVVSLTGVMGGIWEEPAEALAAEGIPTLALAVNNVEGRPTRFSGINVEYVVDAVAWMRKRTQAGTGKVALRGWSRGGELALLAASLSPSINAVIAYSPRTYVGREQDRTNNFGDPAAAPAFTWQGKAAEGVPLPEALRLTAGKPTLEDLHGIAVERIAGPVMLVSGKADTGVAGTTPAFSCEAAMRRLDLFKSPHAHVHYSYPDAGHNIAGPPPFSSDPESGGTVEGDSAAVEASWPLALNFLRRLNVPQS